MVTVLKRISRLIFASMALLGVVMNAYSLDQMASQQLFSACQSHENPAHFSSPRTDVANCRAFIQGYLASAEKFTLPDEQNLSFEQRALQTRAGGQMIYQGVPERNPYWFPPYLTLDDIVTKINSEAALGDQCVIRPSGSSIKAGQNAEDILAVVLKKHFSCTG